MCAGKHRDACVAGSFPLRVIRMDGSGVNHQINVIGNVGSALSDIDFCPILLQLFGQADALLSDPDTVKSSFNNISARPLMLMPPMPIKMNMNWFFKN